MRGRSSTRTPVCHPSNAQRHSGFGAFCSTPEQLACGIGEDESIATPDSNGIYGLRPWPKCISSLCLEHFAPPRAKNIRS
jgi:hypothetical protein